MAERLDIYLKASPHPCACPYCGVDSRHLHSTYERVLQETPFFATPTYLHANVYTYDCENPDCKARTFTERLPKPDVEAVGIDDVAIRKGQKYATAIYDMRDHHLIALLGGRDAATLKELAEDAPDPASRSEWRGDRI